MAFPTTSALSTFANLSDGGPPPTASYETGPYNNDGMVIENGLCIADPLNVSEMGNALWIADTFGPEYEAWAKIGIADPAWSWLSLFLYDLTKTSGYILTWQNNSPEYSITLYDENLTIIWQSVFVPTLTDGYGLGLETFLDNSMIIYTYTANSWQPLIKISGLSIPAVGYIGFGAFSP